MLFKLNLINLILFCEWFMILKNKSDFKKMLDFNPISSFRSYLKFYMLDWIVIYIDKNLRKILAIFMLKTKSNFSLKSLKFY